MAEPLASPGKVIRRLRGTPEEQIAALPPDRPRARRPSQPSAPVSPITRNTASTSTPSASAVAKRSAPSPRPSRAALDQAERLLDDLLKQQKTADEELRREEQRLVRKRRDLERSQQRERTIAERRVEKEREAHVAALSRWRTNR
jgi:hypothetical protein